MGSFLYSEDWEKVHRKDHELIMKSIPPEVNTYLKQHISKYVIPLKSVINPQLNEFLEDEDVINHPSFCQGDFNFDGRTDFAIILTHFDDEAILVMLNQTETLWYDLFFFGTIQNYKKEYVTFDGIKLKTGNSEQVMNNIIWDRVEKRYKIFKEPS